MNKKFYYYPGLKVDKVLLYKLDEDNDSGYEYRLQILFENGMELENEFSRFKWDSEMRQYYDWDFENKKKGMYQYINDEWVQIENWD